jgi:hypothetical protein
MGQRPVKAKMVSIASEAGEKEPVRVFEIPEERAPEHDPTLEKT